MRRFMLNPLICSSVPYLQFDVRETYGAETKRRLAEQVGRVYGEVMQTTPTIVKVAFRELGADNLFRCTEDGAPEPVVVLMCDIRRGRPAEQRARLGAALTAVAAETLQVSPDALEIEFTQHAGDEMYRRGALVADWSPAEADSREADS
jgi:phenylpyruvate tautomerase PptA (4-oxalocrotonate tautomerase family)